MFDKVNINSSKALPLKPLNLLNIMELNSAKGNFKNNGKLPDTFQAKIQLEENLFSSLLQNTGRDIKTYIKNDKARILTESLGGFVLGARIAALSKNPEILGETIAPLAKAVLPYVNKIGLSLATIDWSTRLLAPAVELWQNPQALNKAKLELDTNVSKGLVDYTTMGIGGLAGAGTALKFTPDLIPTAPEFDLKPALKLKNSQTWQGINQVDPLRFQSTSMLDTSWHSIYESEFPASERQSYEFLEQLSKPDSIPQVRLQLTKLHGKTAAFSVTSDYGEGTKGRKLLLTYIAVDKVLQSSGIGSNHLEQLVAELKDIYPTAKGICLEAESPQALNLSQADQVARQARIAWYQKRNAQILNYPYFFPSSTEGEPDIAGKLMWISFNRGIISKEGTAELVRDIYTHGYNLATDHPLVKNLEK